MKLTYFSIRDYRSTSAELDNLQSSTILIGPNNEGKSNVLQALNDDEGRKGFYEAQRSLMAPSNTSFTACLGLPEAEFEDLLSESIYSAYFKSQHSVEVGHAPFNTKTKWSRRMRLGFTKAGKATSVKVNPDGTTTKEHWPETMEYADKRAIAELVVKDPSGAIHPSREDTLKCFVAAVEARLDAIKS